MKIHYYFDMHEFCYEVDDAEIEQRFGITPEDDTARDERNEEIEEYYFDAARDEAKRVSDENNAEIESLIDDYKRSV